MNKEDYVSLEVAKLLYQKGFKINGNYLWNYGTLCPTLYEASKWLRENYNTHINISTNYEGEYSYDCFQSIDDEIEAELRNIESTKKFMFNSYEEALNAGILESLKLI